jgi:hypothetical protein
MRERCSAGLRIAAIAVLAIGALPSSLPAQSIATSEPVRRTIVFHDIEREYFIRLPQVTSTVVAAFTAFLVGCSRIGYGHHRI